MSEALIGILTNDNAANMVPYSSQINTPDDRLQLHSQGIDGTTLLDSKCKSLEDHAWDATPPFVSLGHIGLCKDGMWSLRVIVEMAAAVLQLLLHVVTKTNGDTRIPQTKMACNLGSG